MTLRELDDNWAFRLTGGAVAVLFLAWASSLFLRSAFKIFRTGEHRPLKGQPCFGREARALAWIQLVLGIMGALAALGGAIGTVFFGPRW